MAGKGPTPKPAEIRQRRNKKAGATTFVDDKKPIEDIPKLQNPDKRKFHRLTKEWWKRIWTSPLARGYYDTDIDGLARLALLVDEFYKDPGRKDLMSEIRLQEARFGLSPADRSRLQWEIAKQDETEDPQKKTAMPKYQASTKDPRGILGVAK